MAVTIEIYDNDEITIETVEDVPETIELTVQGLQGVGFKWRGAWAASTAYAANDVVYYQGGTWIANTNFTSGGTFNAANWTLMAGVQIYVQATAPASPALNTLWVDTS